MVQLNWIITDDISTVSLEEFDNERNGIVAGYFELIINQRKEGFVPQREISKNEEGLEDILYWLIHFQQGTNTIKTGKDYEWILLTLNRNKLVIKMNKCVNVYFVNKQTGEIKWVEMVSLQELERGI